MGWELFAKYLNFEVRAGKNVRFWIDVWCIDCTLKDLFPDLYSLAPDKEALVASYLSISGDKHHWNLQFTHDFQDWELASVDGFFYLLYDNVPSSSDHDKAVWLPSLRGLFDVRSYYKVLRGGSGNSFPWRSIWRTKVPQRVAFFVWTVALGRILTVDKLGRRHIVIIYWCYMCKCSGELVDHLLLHCLMAFEVWSFIFYLIGVNWVMPRLVLELLACWPGQFQWHRAARVWMAMPLCLMWSLWNERNQCTFDGIERPVSILKENLLRTLFTWSHVFGVISSTSFLDFIDSLSL